MGACAVKRLTATAGQQNAWTELLREIQLLGSARCRHDSLLPLLAFCLDMRCACLVFPLMRGGNLEDRLLLGESAQTRLLKLGGEVTPALPWMRRLLVMQQAMQGLAFLHSIDELHNDFKPSNILLDEKVNSPPPPLCYVPFKAQIEKLAVNSENSSRIARTSIQPQQVELILS